MQSHTSSEHRVAMGGRKLNSARMATVAWVAVFCASTCGARSDPRTPAYLEPPAVRLFIERSGVYQLSGNELQAAGCELDGMDAASPRLFRDGRELPIEVVGGEDGSLDAQDVIRFYAEATDSVYTRYNVYWLTLGNGPGLRIQQAPPPSGASAAPRRTYHMATVHVEPQKQYSAMMPLEPDGDHWFAARIRYDAPATLSVDLPGLLPDAPEPARVRVRLYGLSKLPPKPDHRTEVAIDDAVVATAEWDGQTPYSIEGAIPPGTLKAQGNTVRVGCVKQEGVQFDLAYVDWVEITYPRDFAAPSGFLRVRAPDARPHVYAVTELPSSEAIVWRIDSPEAIRRVEAEPAAGAGEAVRFADAGAPEGARYVVATPEGMLKVPRMELDSPSSLQSETNQADYIIIAHGSLRQAVEPLAQHRQSTGLSVLTTDVQDVYDEFAFGRAEPSAIKRFLRFAYEQYRRPAPRFVLLVGDASYDYRGHLGALLNLVPTHMSRTRHIGQSACDQWFVCVDGDDWIPELAIGRIPARSPEDVATIVRKILTQETSPPAGPWQRHAIFVADDNEALFARICDAAAAAYERQGWSSEKLYLEKGGANAPELGQNLVAVLNEGCRFVVYVGHATLDGWAHERMLTMAQTEQLANGDKLPVIVSLSCLDGFFAHAKRPDCLAEAWLQNPKGGAVACWSPTAMGYSVAHQLLLNEFAEAVFAARASTLGEAVQLAIRNMLQRRSDQQTRDVALMYVLFGDPAMLISSWRQTDG